jgi:hypothetical protein
MSIIRVQKTANYSVISNEVLNDTEISFRAKGLLCYLLSKPDHWSIQVNHLVTVSTEGRDAVYSIIKELEESGYVTKKKVKGNDGKFSAFQYTIFETRKPLTELPEVVPPVPVKPDISNNGSLVMTEVSVAGKPAKSIRERKIEFLKMLFDWIAANPNKYPKIMYTEFAKYWIEESMNKSRIKLRFEEQRFFDVGRRLGTWFKNCKDQVISDQWEKEEKVPIINELFNNLVKTNQ